MQRSRAAKQSAEKPRRPRTGKPTGPGIPEPVAEPTLGRAGSRAESSEGELQAILQALAASALPRPPLVIYIHGIGNKPAAHVLKVLWDDALFGRDMGDRTRMAYWADIRYAEPLGLPQPGPTPSAVPEAYRAAPDETLVEETSSLVPEQARAFAESLARRLVQEAGRTEQELLEQRMGSVEALGLTAAGVDASLLPNPLRGWLTGPVMKLLVPDTAAFFFNPMQAAAMRARLRTLLQPGAHSYILIAHSMGTVIAYDVLHDVEDAGIEVSLFLTLGSPLGLSEVIDQFKKSRPVRIPPCVRRWLNVADRLDFVAADPTVADEYQHSNQIRDILVRNPGRAQLDPHAVTGYLETEVVRGAIFGLTGATFTNPVADFVLARDLAAEVAGSLERRLSILVELGEALPGQSLDDKRNAVVKTLQEITGEDAGAEIDPLRHYIAARLTPPQIERLVARHAELKFASVWKNTHKTALLDVSIRTIQVWTGQQGYGANGAGIAWAVLDTGIRADHPHFEKHKNLQGMWDCTRVGKPVQGLVAVEDPATGVTAHEVIERDPRGNPSGTDYHGHGTHIAGIIAGEERDEPDTERERYYGMAPRTRLYSYKVLDDQGHGEDAAIIKALDHIFELNESSSELLIHGVNLSLGGAFDPKVFQCGFSPICREVRRLWRQGVVVCIASGNDARLTLLNEQGRPQAVNIDLSIGDPANLEEAIAVGSVHRQSPNLYGVSYFSSRGPTADGRCKPDVVAPGEEIHSCNARLEGANVKSYVPMSGTSMACPHVSGLLAAFLSVRREYIGYPEKVKEILMANCTDLGRDRYHQGAGLPNLVKMLAFT